MDNVFAFNIAAALAGWPVHSPAHNTICILFVGVNTQRACMC